MKRAQHRHRLDRGQREFGWHVFGNAGQAHHLDAQALTGGQSAFQIGAREVLQAQRQLAALNAAQIDLSIQLMQALGGGFQSDNLAMASPSPAPATRTHN